MNLLDALRDDAKQLLDQEVPGLEEARSVLGALVRRVESIELYLAQQAGVATSASTAHAVVSEGDSSTTVAASTEGTPPASPVVTPPPTEPPPVTEPVTASETAAEAPSRDVAPWEPGA